MGELAVNAFQAAQGAALVKDNDETRTSAADFEDIIAYDCNELPPEDSSDEEFCIDGQVDDDEGFERAIGELEDLIIDERFQAIMKEMLDENCEIFEDAEENKLEYTTVFSRWTERVEQYIEQEMQSRIDPSFRLHEFATSIMRKAQAGASKESAASASTSSSSTLAAATTCDAYLETIIDPGVLELLVSISDFESFRGLMVEHRKNQHNVEGGGGLVLTGTAAAVHQDEIEEGDARPDLDDAILAHSPTRQ